MLKDVKKAHAANAANLIEVAQAALARIAIAQLEPEHRVDLRTADELLNRTLAPLKASLDEAAPESDMR